MNALPTAPNVKMLNNFSIQELLPMRETDKAFKADIDYILRIRYKRFDDPDDVDIAYIIKYLAYFENNVLNNHKPTYVDLDIPRYISAGSFHDGDYARAYRAYIDGTTVSIIYDLNRNIEYIIPELYTQRVQGNSLRRRTWFDLLAQSSEAYKGMREGILVNKYTVSKILTNADETCFLLENQDRAPRYSYVIITLLGGYSFVAPEPILGINEESDGQVTMITVNYFIYIDGGEGTGIFYNIKDIKFGAADDEAPEPFTSIEKFNIRDVTGDPTDIELQPIIPEEIRTLGGADNDDATIANIVAQGQHNYEHNDDVVSGHMFIVQPDAEPYISAEVN